MPVQSTGPTPEEVEAYRKAYADEYGVYVANGPIDIDGVRAYNEGDPVSTSHVEGTRQGIFDPETEKVTWHKVGPKVAEDLVSKRTTKAGKAAVADAAKAAAPATVKEG